FPRSAEHVAATLQLARAHRVPVFSRGAGSGLSGGSVPDGGIALVMTQMNRILEVDLRNLQMVVEAGAITAAVQQAARVHGLFYPPDPGSSRVSTIGGNIAENAAGPHSFQYGPTGNYVLGLEVVLASGDIVELGARTTKNACGYDLVRLMVGSEGTLGVVTKARLRLLPLPPARASLLAAGFSPEELEDLIVLMAGSPHRPSSIELLDRFCVRLLADRLEAAIGTDVPGGAYGLILADFLGQSAEVAEKAQALAESVRGRGAPAVAILDGTQQAELWGAREELSPRVARIEPTKISEDATVPLGELAGFMRDMDAIRGEFRVEVVVFGHAGDGNLHPNFLTDERDPERMRRTWQAIDALFEAAIRRGGTLTGEHGVGRLKLPYMRRALPPNALELMVAVKRALDPDGILNPGKAILEPASRAPGADGARVPQHSAG
ncbi:MAG: FAD-linked oxidase C-terminal domain-containing protein, partial [Bacillota bacterium]